MFKRIRQLRISLAAKCQLLFGAAVLLQGIYVLAILSTNRKESSLGRMIVGLFVYVFWISFQHLSALLNLRHARWNRTERG